MSGVKRSPRTKPKLNMPAQFPKVYYDQDYCGLVQLYITGFTKANRLSQTVFTIKGQQFLL